LKPRVSLLVTGLKRGGAEGQVAQLARGLQGSGLPVEVISLTSGGKFFDELAASGIQVSSLDMEGGASLPGGLARLAMRLRSKRPQVVHAHLFHANILARLVRLAAPIPVVISTLHSVAESSRKHRSTLGRDIAYRLTDSLCDATVAVSREVAEQHLTRGAVRASKLYVVPNGVDVRRFRPDAEMRIKIRRHLGLEEEFVWLWVGRMIWKKDPETLIDAFARVGRGVLLVAGSGPDENSMRALAQARGARVMFLGERDDVAGLMQAADGFVLSSVVEGLPVALLEAAASGLPVVATRAGGVAGIIEDGLSGFLAPPGDAAALANQMLRVMELSHEQRRRIGLAARRKVCAEFDAELVCRRWLHLYQELLRPWT